MIYISGLYVYRVAMKVSHDLHQRVVCVPCVHEGVSMIYISGLYVCRVSVKVSA